MRSEAEQMFDMLPRTTLELFRDSVRSHSTHDAHVRVRSATWDWVNVAELREWLAERDGPALAARIVKAEPSEGALPTRTDSGPAATFQERQEGSTGMVGV
jgi:hypothetical protein